MNTPPDDLDERVIAAALWSQWGFDVAELTYRPVGFGSHHWLATGADGTVRFISVDDLALKRGNAGDTTDAVFARLRRAFTAAAALRHEAGLEFVVAPLAAGAGGVLARLDDRYSMVVHPDVAGRPAGTYGEYESPADRSAVLDVVVRLHGATDVAAPHAGREDGTLAGRQHLDRALVETAAPWAKGPYGEPARRLVAEHAADVARLLFAYDELAAQVMAEPGRMVMTHGEPHAGNVVMGAGGPLLVDWDTALVAPPERDLWDLDPGDGTLIERYREATGVAARPDALTFYRLRWDLADIAVYLSLFRTDHGETADTAESWENLVRYLDPAVRWPSIVC